MFIRKKLSLKNLNNTHKFNKNLQPFKDSSPLQSKTIKFMKNPIFVSQKMTGMVN